MVFSDCYGDCSIGEFDLIVRGPSDHIIHEVLHILLKLSPEDAMKVTELYLDHLSHIVKELQDGE